MGKKKQIRKMEMQVNGLLNRIRALEDFNLLAPEEREAKVKRILMSREIAKKFAETMEKTMLPTEEALREDIAKMTGPWPAGHWTNINTGFPGRTWDTLYKPGPGDNIEIPPIPAEIQADKDNADFVRQQADALKRATFAGRERNPILDDLKWKPLDQALQEQEDGHKPFDGIRGAVSDPLIKIRVSIESDKGKCEGYLEVDPGLLGTQPTPWHELRFLTGEGMGIIDQVAASFLNEVQHG